ncbi:MAG TPA: nucleotidyltransferase domain-containing protein [Candidatus Angelobacter sp.]|nr:nucleotidyltransferase domain-containing protein [Candidatus Angelobacter sp.]
MSSQRRPLLDHIRDSGFGCPETLIHCFVGGSELHGARVGATDDLDIYGVFVEEPEAALGLDDQEHFVWSTAGAERRNGPDDVDVTLYSLRKWASLAAKGNPTALHFLFARSEEVRSATWDLIVSNRALFMAKNSSAQFIGFATNQRQRITGEKGRGAKGKRLEYECKYGYDTKAAMHTLRLLYEGIELMECAHITLPRPEKELLIEVRSGAWPLEKFIHHAEVLSGKLSEAAAKSKLPELADRRAVSTLIAKAHLQHWSREKMPAQIGLLGERM